MLFQEAHAEKQILKKGLVDPHTVLPFIILAELLASFKSLFFKNLTVKIFFNYLFVSSILL